MRIINAKECAVVALGRLGENEYTVVRFDVTAWLEEVPGAVIGLYNQRPGDGAAYPVAGITVDGGIATWTVTSAELTQTGEGRCELVAIAGEVVAKSAIFRTMVFDALNGSGEAPEPWEEWQQQLIILKNEAEQAADRAEEAVEHYPRIVDGIWEVWDAQTCAFVSTGVQAQGEPGDDGVTFTPTVSSEGVISWTNDGGLPNPQPVNIKGPQGDDYILTAADKEEIAQQAAESLAPALDEKAHVIYCEASGAIASFTDGAEDMPLKSCIVNVEPVQDLHGYDNPWPAGGGVNKIDVNQLRSYGTTYGLTVSFDGDWIVLSGEYTNTKQAANFRIATLRDTSVFPVTKFKAFPDSNTSPHMTSAPFGLADGNKTLTIYISGMVQGETYNLRFKIVGYEGDTAPTEWTPYANICPISGFDSVKVNRTGKNLLDIARLQNWANWDMNLVADGDYPTSSGNRAVALSVKPNTTYTISAEKKETETTWPSYLYLCKYSNGVGARLIYFSDNYKTLTFTTEENTLYYLRMGSSNTQQLFDASIGKLGWIQLELGSTATDYEPYQGETYDIAFPSDAGTVYGGSLSIAEDGSGVLTVDRAEVDLGTLNYGVTDVNRFYNATPIPDFVRATSTNERATGILCSIYKPSSNLSYSSSQDDCSWLRGNTTSVFDFCIKDERYTSTSDFRTAMSGVQLVYELATPITYTLTTQEIRTLLGTNNIWADTGDTTVEYKADTKMYIDNKITQAIAAALNSAD